MKNLFYFMLLCFTMSCANHDSSVEIKPFSANTYPQKWKLVQMSGNTPTSASTGANMPWQESYLFNGDGTFIKSRVRDGVTTEGSGTYTLTTPTANENLLTLKYTSESDLVGSCMSAKEESLWLKSITNMSSTWLACDGPGLDYERVE